MTGFSNYSKEQLESRLKEVITVDRNPDASPEDKTRAKMIGLALQDALRKKEYKQPSVVEQTFNMFDKVSKHHDKRVNNAVKRIEEYSKPESGYSGTPESKAKRIGLGVAGQSAGLALDAVGEAVQAVMPEEVQDYLSSALTYLMDTETAQTVMQNWSELPEKTRMVLEDAFNVNALLFPKMKTGVGYGVEKGANAVAGKTLKASDMLRRKRLSNLLMEPKADTAAGKQSFFKNQFELSRDHWRMVDTLDDVPGLTPMRSFQANGKILFKELDKSSKALRNRLRTMPRKIPEGDISDTLQTNLDNLLKEDHFLQKDKAIMDAFDLNLQKMQEIIDSNPKTPEGLLTSRQQFDKILNSKIFDQKFEPTKRAAIDESAKLMRRTVNQLIQKYAPETDVIGMLNKQHQLYRGIDSLAYQYAASKGMIETGAQLMQQHPYIAYGLLTGTGMTGAAASGLLPAAAGAAIVGGAGLTGYRYAPELVKAVAKVVKGAGKGVNEFPVGVGRAGLFYGQDDQIQETSLP